MLDPLDTLQPNDAPQPSSYCAIVEFDYPIRYGFEICVEGVTVEPLNETIESDTLQLSHTG